MKILILANNDVGLYQFRKELIEQLLKDREVFISLPFGELVEPLRQMGCTFLDTPVDRRGINPLTDLKLFFTYRSLLRKVRPDLVITYTIKPNIYGGMACRLAGITYAANITGLGTAFQKPGALRTLVTVLYRSALRKAKTVFFENQGNLQTLLEKRIVRETQCCLLNGAGVNLERYAYAEYPAEDGVIRFLFMGRIMREKGVDELFSAMRELRREGVNCTLDMLGGCEENYKDTIEICQAEGWLRYHGYQKDVRPFIETCHCFVLPSWHEGMANTNLECAAMGRPLITSRIPGCQEAVEEGVSGLLCSPGDAGQLAQIMRAFAALPHAQKEAMGRAGRRRMEGIFDKNKVVEETIIHLMGKDNHD